MCDNNQAINPELVEKIKEVSNSIWKNLLSKESLHRQKSRQKWMGQKMRFKN